MLRTALHRVPRVSAQGHADRGHVVWGSERLNVIQLRGTSIRNTTFRVRSSCFVVPSATYVSPWHSAWSFEYRLSS